MAVVDGDGRLVAKRRIADSVAGLAQLLALLAEVGDGEQNPVPVAIETPRGLLVAALRATGRKVYAINPMAVARYRERWTLARSKSDHADALVLANILRTDELMTLSGIPRSRSAKFPTRRVMLDRAYRP